MKMYEVTRDKKKNLVIYIEPRFLCIYKFKRIKLGAVYTTFIKFVDPIKDLKNFEMPYG